MTHPSNRIDDVVHQRARLGILATLASVERVEFSHLRDTLNLTDGNLSRHIQVLDEVGFVKVTKTFAGKKPLTTLSITKTGRAAFEAEVAALREIVLGFDHSNKK